jgi:acetyl esterase
LYDPVCAVTDGRDDRMQTDPAEMLKPAAAAAHDPLSDPHQLLDPAMRRVLAHIERARRTPLLQLEPAQARAAYAAGADMLEIPKPVLSRVQELSIPARDGYAIPARLIAPSLERLPVLLYFHGGGFTIGSIETHDVLCRRLAELAGCAVISVDYRLAPEHRFPTAADDAWDATIWLAANGTVLGLDGARIAVGGDSAGGTLAAVCALLARDANLPLALQLLFYPGCSAHQDTPSHRRFGSGFLLDAEQIQWFFSLYLRSPADRDDWRFAPLDAPDVDGVAPAWFGLAECDPLVDEGLLYADRLRAAGVQTDLEIYRGMTHEFIKMGRAVSTARQAHSDAAAALRKAFSL